MVGVGLLVTVGGALPACGGITQHDGASATDDASSGATGSASTGSTGGVSTGGTAAAAGGDCVARPVTFSVHPAPGSADEWCVGLPDCSSLVTLRDPLGKDLMLRSWCGVACESCEAELCPPLICIPPRRLEPGFDEFAWDGTRVVTDFCGAAATQCNRSTCASPGRYTAVVCAVPNPAPDPAAESCANLVSASPTCVEQQFDVGDTTEVTITLPAQQ